MAGDQTVEKWKETTLSDRTTGIPRGKLREFLELVKGSFDFSDAKRSEQFFNTIMEVTENEQNNTNGKGTTATLYGDLDEKTALYGIFHCISASDDTFSIAYSIHTLSTQMTRTDVQSDIFWKPDVLKEVKFGYLAEATLNELRGMGVPVFLNRPESSKTI